MTGSNMKLDIIEIIGFLTAILIGLTIAVAIGYAIGEHETETKNNIEYSSIYDTCIDYKNELYCKVELFEEDI